MIRPRAIVLMGVSGSGKTTVGTRLGALLGWRFEDADAWHPPENVAKMARGEPLDDADRAPWLARLAALLSDAVARGEPLVLACSALRRRYRAVLAAGSPAVGFAFLAVPPALLRARLAARAGHFFAPSLLDSQLATLEPPAADEALIVTVGPGDDPDTLASRIAQAFGLAPAPVQT